MFYPREAKVDVGEMVEQAIGVTDKPCEAVHVY